MEKLVPNRITALVKLCFVLIAFFTHVSLFGQTTPANIEIDYIDDSIFYIKDQCL